MISLLFNGHYYDISNKTNKELAIRSFDSKLICDSNEIGYLKGFSFDFKLIGGPNEEDLQLFKKQSEEKIFASYKDIGKLDEFKNMVRDGMTEILEIIDDGDYANFVEKYCFTEDDYENFLEEQNIEDVNLFGEEYRYVFLFKKSKLHILIIISAKDKSWIQLRKRY